jgi:hypothetical protein
MRTVHLLTLTMLAAGAGSAAPPAVDFNRDIRPLLNTHCLRCHGGVKQAGDLSLLFRIEALKAGKSGHPAIVPGDPARSEFMARVRHADPEERMPQEAAPLPAADIAKLEQWIAAGAEWADHWSYVPPRRTDPPATRFPTRNRVDAFLFARLEKEKLAPAPEADRATLLRRVSLDLIGLPPTPDEVNAFLASTAPDAYEQQVDRLLASPRFGERWASWWMDLARYADSKGYEKDGPRQLWPYRDWLIDAFNRDLPFDQFTIDQLAGDLLPDPTEDQVIATAFHRNTMNNDEGGTDDEEFRVAAVLDRTHTTMEVWNGQTWSCVQCHSHPYDPFPHREFYEVLAFFNQSQDSDKGDDRPTRPVVERGERAARAELETRRAQLQQQRAALDADPAYRAGLSAWLKTGEPVGRWLAPAAVEVEATGGAAYQREPAGTFVAAGENPLTNSILARVQAGARPVEALRLDLVPDAAMKAGGVGRSRDGNVVLSRIRVFQTFPGGAPPPARYARITLPGTGRILNFAELELISAGSNVARRGKASASSVDFGARPEFAIDGNPEPSYEKAPAMHSATEANPWWEVDLLAAASIEEIRLVNRLGQERRLDGARVELLDEQRKPVWTRELPVAGDLRYAWRTGETELPIAAAWADHEQADFGVDHALRGERLADRGWAVGPRMGEAHHAVFVLDRPVPAGQALRVQLDWLYHQPAINNQCAPHRFRLSVSDEPALRRLAALAPAERTAMRKPEAQRSPAESAALAAVFARDWPAAGQLQQQLAEVEKRLAERKTVALPVMADLPPAQARTTQVFNRGNWMAKGEVVTARTPHALHPFPADAPSNRLGLARWLVSTNGPLTARVTVNRFWEQLFGIGIVETLEDFGTQGERPVHPELLDDLAARFQSDLKWSMKALLRELVISAAYRQDSKIAPALLEKDPRNRLLARGPRFRLSAEQLRDQALAASGLLSMKMYGEPVMPFQPAGIWLTPYDNRDWHTSAGEDAYRRALYTHWRRSSPYPSMLTFDGAARDVCQSRRLRTNTPLQALNLLNDRAYLDCAAALGRTMAAAGATDPAQAVSDATLRLLGRPPRESETRNLLALREKAQAEFARDEAAAKKFGDSVDHAAWTLVANAMLNLDEVVTKQ